MLSVGKLSIENVVGLIQAAAALVQSVRSGHTKVVDGTGHELTQDEVNQKFANLDVLQTQVGQDIAGRIEHAHRDDA